MTLKNIARQALAMDAHQYGFGLFNDGPVHLDPHAAFAQRQVWFRIDHRRIRNQVEFAVQRAMGLSRPQVFQMLALEYSVVAVAGVVTGAILGLIVGRQMLSFLDATEDGARVEPSFILQTEWTVVAGAVGVVGLIFLGALLLATRYLATTSDAAALRTE